MKFIHFHDREGQTLETGITVLNIVKIESIFFPEVQKFICVYFTLKPVGFISFYLVKQNKKWRVESQVVNWIKARRTYAESF